MRFSPFRHIYAVLRGVLVTAILVVVVGYSAAYVTLSLPAVQERVRAAGEAELSRLLGVEASVGELQITPFNRVLLKGVAVPDLDGDTLLSVDRLGVGVSLYDLVVKRRLTLTYAEVIGLRGSVTRPDKQSATNAQFLIDALGASDSRGAESDISIEIYNIVLRKSALSYDVLSEEPLEGALDPNHLAVTGLSADIAVPSIGGDECRVRLKRLSLAEKSGLHIDNVTADIDVAGGNVSLGGFSLDLANSHLALADISVQVDSLGALGSEITRVPVTVRTVGSYVTPSDLAAVAPSARNFGDRVGIELTVESRDNTITVDQLRLSTTSGSFLLNAAGKVAMADGASGLSYNLSRLELSAKAEEIARVTDNLAALSPKAERIVGNCGDVEVAGTAQGTLERHTFTGTLATSAGSLNLDGTFDKASGGDARGYSGHISTEGLDVGGILGDVSAIGSTAFALEVDLTLDSGGLSGTAEGDVRYADINGYRYSDITANLTVDESKRAASVKVDDENLRAQVEGQMVTDSGVTLVAIKAQASDVNLAKLNISDKYPDQRLSLEADVMMQGSSPDNTVGTIELRDVAFRDSAGHGVGMERFTLTSTVTDSLNRDVRISSDMLNGSITGAVDHKYFIPMMRNMLAQSFPSLIEAADTPETGRWCLNNVTCDLSLAIPEEVEKFFGLPVGVLVPLTLTGYADEDSQSAQVEMRAQYLGQKNKLIEDTWAVASVDGGTHSARLQAHSIIPMKNGKMNLNIDVGGANDSVDANIGWVIPRESDFSGQLSLSALLGRETVGDAEAMTAIVDINPTELVFNDTAWQVNPAKIKVTGRTVDVIGLRASCSEQFIAIDGRVSDDERDELRVTLNDINLNYVFETLGIETAMFGGRGTGTFYASALYSDAPRIATPSLLVDGIEYNHAPMGDADIVSLWNVEKQEVEIHAVVSQANGCTTLIDGGIFPMNDSLYFEFRPQKANAKFLAPYMSAFASDVEGRASGFCCLYGTFSDIDLYGDVYADTLMVKLDFTGTRYYVYGDSVKMVPGRISFKDVDLYDQEGHTSKLTGWVSHEFFHNPRFNFQITDARDFLCYDMPPSTPDQNWYGTVYGNGTVVVNGEPGLVVIDANVRTAAGSTFTYELSDTEYAYEYDFITFTDRTPREEVADTLPERVRELQLRSAKSDSGDSESVYRINILADITNSAQINLVMDPVGGDRIRCRGTGNLRMTYSNEDEILTMLGNYRLEQGRYNFTLQDIIVREFTIQEGSTITFTGDPFAAQVDITAYYALNANLQDLDESFATDKDMNRTNVPVRALLLVSGLITEPEISFDLSFPTLTAEADRKVRSVISTDDMMNRQIIYLLALNRFYTPEYMSSTSSSNNELASVASSTISSQLASILGQLSDNWSIAPNFHSDKGDFSDVEVELALSSQLLNNRLLLNGNFGYRDNTLSSSTNFIGDFDLEYLLTKNGNIRLKAYNHFNDQNYYIKSALTTQGVGVVFKRDFDRVFDFIKRKKSNEATEAKEAETTGTEL